MLNRCLTFGLGVAIAIGTSAPAMALMARAGAQEDTPAKAEEESSETRAQSEASASHHLQSGEMVKVGSDAVVAADEKVTDLVVVLGNAKLEGEVGGDMVVVFGNAEANGKVGGDCVTVFGSLKLGPQAQLGGDTIVVGGHIDKDAGAQLSAPPIEVSFEKFLPQLDPLWKWIKRGLLLLRPLPPSSGLAWIFVGTFFLIYLVIVLLMPRPMETCVGILEKQAVVCFFVGLLALILSGPLVFILIASGVGLLIVPFVKLALSAAGLVGKAACLQYIGFGLGRRFNATTCLQPLPAFLLGAALVTVLYMVPILGFVLWGVLCPLGLGVAILAAFRAFRRNGRNGDNGHTASPTATLGASSAVNACGTTGGTPPIATSSASPASPQQDLAAVSTLDYANLPRVGFWLRFAASLLDLILLGWLLSHTDGLGVLVWLAYHVGMWTWKGTTIGGIICGIKVVRVDGRNLDFGVAFVRALAAVFSLVSLGLGYFWAGWTKEKQSWHDKIAGTIIVKVPRGVSLI